MEAKQAINILVQAAQKGQSAGAYSLQDAAMIMQAIVVLDKVEQSEKSKKEGKQEK